MGRLKVQKNQVVSGTGTDIAYPQISTLTDPVTPPGLTNANFYGVVGGDIKAVQSAAYNQTVAAQAGTAAFPVIKPSVNVGSGPELGYIVSQRGTSTFLVTGVVSGVTKVCQLTNSAQAGLTSGQMSVAINNGTSTVYLKRMSNKYGIGFDGIQYFLNSFASNTGVSSVSKALAGWDYGNGTAFVATFAASPTPPFVVGGTVTFSGVVGPALNGTYVVSACTVNSVTCLSAYTAPGSDSAGGTISQNIAGTPFVAKSGADLRTWVNNTAGTIAMVQVPHNP